MSQEEKLFHLYAEKLEALRTSFNRDPTSPFIGVNLREGAAPAFGDWFSAWQSNTIHIYSDQSMIFDELLDFSALVSYMSLSYRRSLYFLHVVFLLRFRTSTDLILKKICAKIYEGVANEQERAKAKYLLYYHQIVDMITEETFLLDYLPALPISLTFTEFYNSFYPIWYDLQGRGLRFEDMAKLFSIAESNLSVFFSRKKQQQQAWRELTQKFLGESVFFIQYDRLGLFTYVGTLILNPLLKDPTKIINEIAKIPFFQGFFGTNLEYQFYINIPKTVKSKVKKYFQNLYSQNLIIHFEMRKYVSFKTVLQFDSRVAKPTFVRNLYPFSSLFWKFSRTRKKLIPKQQLKVYQSDYITERDEEPAISLRWTPLHLYLAFNRLKLFRTVFHYKNPSAFLQFIQQNITSFSQSIDLNISPRVVKKLAHHFKSMDPIPNETSNFFYMDDNLAAINRIATVLHYNFIKDRSYPLLKEMWQEYCLMSDSFKMKQNISKTILQKTIIQLIKSQMLIENRPLQFSDIIQWSWDNIITLVETPHKIDILESSLLLYSVEIFQTEEGMSSYRYRLSIPTQYWTSFCRLFFDIQGCHFYCVIQQVDYENADDLVFFYNYPTQSWNLAKFNVPPYQSDILHPQYLPPGNHPKTSQRRVTAEETIHNFSHMIATAQRSTLISNQLTKSRDDYMKLLELWIEPRQISKETIRKFLKDHFSIGFNQVSNIIQTINFHTVPLPQYRNKQKIVIILQKYSFPCHPEVLLADPLLSCLFCHGLLRIAVSSGGLRGFLVLEYEFPTTILDNPKSQINQLLVKLNQHFHIDLHYLVIHHEYRFYSKQLLHRPSMKTDGFSHLKYTKNEASLLNPFHVHYNYVEKKISSTQHPPVYCDQPWKWAFWQIIGYPVEIGIYLKTTPAKQKSVISYLMKLPIGTIYVHERGSTELNVSIIANLRCVKNLYGVLFFLSNFFKELKIQAYISLLTNYAMMQNKLFSQLISQSQVHDLLRTSSGDILEIPLIKNDKIFSLEERIWLYSRLEKEICRGKYHFTTQSWRSFLEALCEIDNVCLESSQIEKLIERLFNRKRSSYPRTSNDVSRIP